MFPIWLQAGFWGLVAGSALLMGAAAGYLARMPQRVIAGIMAFWWGRADFRALVRFDG